LDSASSCLSPALTISWSSTTNSLVMVFADCCHKVPSAIDSAFKEAGHNIAAGTCIHFMQSARGADRSENP